MKELTPRQKSILEFIQNVIRERGIAPSIREIQEEFQFRSPNSVTTHLRALSKKGRLEIEPNTSRGLRIPGFAAAIAQQLPLVQKNSRDSGKSYVLDNGFFKQNPSFLYQMYDNSLLEAGIRKGDFLCISRDCNIKVGDIAFVERHNKSLVGIVKRRQGKLLLATSDASPQQVELQTTISAKVVGIVRRISQ